MFFNQWYLKDSSSKEASKIRFFTCPHCGEKIYYSGSVTLGHTPEVSTPPPTSEYIKLFRAITTFTFIAVLVLLILYMANTQGCFK